jgi:hypothetical protein
MSSRSTSVTPSTEELIGLLVRALTQPDVPWPPGWGEAGAQSFLESVRHHGVGPLLWRSLHRSSRLEGWPEKVRKTLSDASRRAAVAEMLRKQAVGRVLAALDSSLS